MPFSIMFVRVPFLARNTKMESEKNTKTPESLKLRWPYDNVDCADVNAPYFPIVLIMKAVSV